MCTVSTTFFPMDHQSRRKMAGRRVTAKRPRANWMSTKKVYATSRTVKYRNWVIYIELFYSFSNSYKSCIAFSDITDAEEIYANVIKDFPTYLSAHISLIQKLELAETKNSLPLTYKSTLEKSNNLETNKATLQRIIDLADVVIEETNAEVLLAFYGLKTDNRPDAAKIKT